MDRVYSSLTGGAESNRHARCFVNGSRKLERRTVQISSSTTGRFEGQTVMNDRNGEHP